MTFVDEESFRSLGELKVEAREATWVKVINIISLAVFPFCIVFSNCCIFLCSSPFESLR